MSRLKIYSDGGQYRIVSGERCTSITFGLVEETFTVQKKYVEHGWVTLQVEGSFAAAQFWLQENEGVEINP